MSDATDRTASRPRRALPGWALLAVWLAAVTAALSVMAHSALPVTAALDTPTAAQASAWLSTLPGHHPGRATIVRLQPTRCACTASGADWPRHSDRWRAGGATVLDATGMALPARLRAYELALFDPAGRPVFLGPADTGPMCGDHHPVDALLASIASPATAAAVMLPAFCDCP